MPIIFVTQDKCLFQDISRSELVPLTQHSFGQNLGKVRILTFRFCRSEAESVYLEIFSFCVHCSMLALSSLSTSSNCPVSIPSFVPSEKDRHNKSRYTVKSLDNAMVGVHRNGLC